MSTVQNRPTYGSQTIIAKVVDLLIGFLGSLIVGNVGIISIAQFDTPERLWMSVFTWVWRLVAAGLALFFFTKKRIWLTIGLAASILLQAFGV